MRDLPVISKGPDPKRAAPNLADYEASRDSFHWTHARELLSGLPDNAGLNIAHEAVDRYAKGDLENKVAIRWLGKDDSIRDLTYGNLYELTNRFANALGDLGVKKGDRIYALTGRVPELYVTALGALKHRAVFCPLFSAFGPVPLKQRLALGTARVLVTTERLYRKKVVPIRAELPHLEHVVIVGSSSETPPPDTHDWATLIDGASPHYAIEPTDPEDPALLHFTSGTTGKPKGALHVHEAVVMHQWTGRMALDLHEDDIYWCTADPGWVTGTSYGIIAPLTNGVTMLVDEAEFDAERWYDILADHQVTVWYTAPTAIRMLMRSGVAPIRKRDLSALRFLASVGEPLNPEAVIWSQEAFGRPFHDNWWQSETGGILIANFASMDVRPGSMGKPLPGIGAAVVQREGDRVTVLDDPDVEGELAIRRGWPSMFRAYWNEPDRYAKCFAGDWYLTGDLAKRDADGYFWFVGRADDVIKSAGHLIGPFEVESVLIEHAAVAEAGVIGKPDPVAGAIVKAFVSLQPGTEPSDALRSDLLGFARKTIGSSRGPARNRVLRDPAENPEWKDHATSPQSARTGSARRRHVHVWRARRHDARCSQRPCPPLPKADGPRAALRGEGGGALWAAEDQGVPAPLRRGGSRCRRHPQRAETRGQHRRHLPRARARSRARRHARRGHGRDVRQGKRLLPRSWRLDAPLLCQLPLLWRPCNRRRRASDRGGSRARRSDARRQQGSRRVSSGTVRSTKESSTNHLNLAALWKLPVLFLCENNRYAMGTALERHQADTDLTHKPAAYGVVAESVDGMDVVAVERATRYAADSVRDGGGPRFLELKTYRFRAHSMYDAERYRDKAEVEHWKEQDPIERFRRQLIEAPASRRNRIRGDRGHRRGGNRTSGDVCRGRPRWEPVEKLTRNVYVRELGR